MAFFSLSTINNVQPLLAPLMKLNTVNGINSQFTFNETEVPDRVAAINYEAAMLSNFNYMAWLVAG